MLSNAETTRLVELIEKVKQWHHERNLIHGATDKDQVCKLIQEVGELSDNVCKGRDIRDDIGDCIVVLVNIAERNGISITDCCEQAYNDIKDRKGKMVDGIFVKEADDDLQVNLEFDDWYPEIGDVDLSPDGNIEDIIISIADAETVSIDLDDLDWNDRTPEDVV